MVTLPTTTDGTDFYSFEVELEGRVYTFSFRWNDRAAGWFMDLDDSAGDRLLTGVRVVVGWPLLGSRRVDARLPPGELVAVPAGNDESEAGLRELGGRVQLAYLTAEEMAGA